MLKRIYAHNYRSLVNFELRPEAVNLFLGPNGSGKSAIFEVLAGLHGLLVADQGVERAFPVEAVTRVMGIAPQRFELELSDVDDTSVFTYLLILDNDAARGKMAIFEERVTFEGRPLYAWKSGEAQLFEDNGAAFGAPFSYPAARSFVAAVEARPQAQKLVRFRELLQGMKILDLDVLRIESASAQESTTLERTGGNFAAWYRNLAQEDHEAVNRLHQSLRPLIPGLKWLKSDASGRARVLSATFEWPEGQAQYTLDFNQLSNGQRALIVLYAVLHAGARDAGILCFDEPENYVALTEVQPWLAGLRQAAADGQTQVFVISHHPEVIDYLAADNAFWFSRPDGAQTRVKRMVVERESGLRASEWVLGRYEDEP